MRKIERFNTFRKDYKREVKGKYRSNLDADLVLIFDALVKDFPLPSKRHDHSLVGNWRGCRECHVKPDLLLIYRKPDDDRLELIRLGSHSELFG